jgi:hypothetical protein
VGGTVVHSTIESIEVLPGDHLHWDIQVPGTNNYVTVDGTIHHNSGKTIGMIMEILRRAREMPPYSDGVRRTRVAIVRNTLQQIKTTCLVSWMEWLRPISRYKVSDQTIEVRLDLPDGTRVELDCFLLPLDTPENQQRLLSLELTMVWVSEFREVPLEILHAAFSRCGRYPSSSSVKEYFYGLIAESNSFSIDSDYYEFLEVDRPENVDYFVQPGARSPEAENREHLKPGYYENMIEANSEAWVASYIDNKLMPSLSGQAVFANSFDPAVHVAASELSPVYGRNVVIGIDVGRHPAATIGQIDISGRMLVLHALWAENMGIDKFLLEKLKPVLYERFAAQAMFAVLDPAARAKSQIGETSVLDAVRAAGINAVLANTNDISPRLRAVEGYLNRRNGILFCPVHAQSLIQAMQYGYRFRRKKGTNILEEIPEKLHPASDLADSCQYMCLGAESRVMAAAVRRATTHISETRRKEPSAAGWT